MKSFTTMCAVLLVGCFLLLLNAAPYVLAILIAWWILR